MADKLEIINRGLQRIGAKRLVTLTENTRERQAVDAAYDSIVKEELMTNFWTFAIVRAQITKDVSLWAKSATVAAGGTLYALGDLLTLVGGTFTRAAIFEVTGVTAGVVTAVEPTGTRGEYSVAPTSPVSTTNNGVGDDACTLTLTTDTGPVFGRSSAFTQPSDYLRSAPRDPQEAAFYKSCLYEQNKIIADDGGPLELRYVSDLSDLGNFQTTFTNLEDLFHPLFANAISMRLAMEVAEELVGSGTKLDRVESAYTFFVNKARLVDAIEAGPIEPEVDEFVAVRGGTSVDPTLRKFS